ncbi:glycoside hydrolase family 88 protein [Massilia sp. CT11-108]|uniref:glycoside hydrolase family 88 protein n=1 Tax=Massilia sp. CT11-108 TaxID=3393900 RepID=UPI0039A6914C
MTPPLNAAALEPLNTGALPAHWNRGIDKAAIDRAIARALDAVDRNLAHFGDAFPMPSSKGGVYEAMDNTEWTNGFWTGMLWLAYELTGAARYRDAGLRHVASFHARQRDRINVNHHDLGFLYSLSCVSGYQLTGEPLAAEAALGAARMLLERYLPGAGIIQAWGELSDPAQRGRMIIDCNLNLPLLYWASDFTGDPAFRTAADRHIEAAARHIVRPDGSTFHTFFFDPGSGAPRPGQPHPGGAGAWWGARGPAGGPPGAPPPPGGARAPPRAPPRPPVPPVLLPPGPRRAAPRQDAPGLRGRFVLGAGPGMGHLRLPARVPPQWRRPPRRPGEGAGQLLPEPPAGGRHLLLGSRVHVRTGAARQLGRRHRRMRPAGTGAQPAAGRSAASGLRMRRGRHRTDARGRLRRHERHAGRGPPEARRVPQAERRRRGRGLHLGRLLLPRGPRAVDPHVAPLLVITRGLPSIRVRPA